ncbi:histidine ammonia-lyase [Mycoplasma sp. P36-A1]|uniref:histidine ammonia-lyase n=1 Tax=Mycoplasma sp. P36-A1 TaxID=3252900 RepID=UPI003C2C4186
MKTIKIDGNNLTLNEFIEVARFDAKVEFTDQAIKNMQRSRDLVEHYVENDVIRYGITTGFGSLCEVAISKKDTSKLQENLIITHAVGVGKPLDIEIVRGMMLLRANSIAKGNSGVRVSTVQLLLDMLNNHVIPLVPEKGSLGASGDLAPLSHMVLPMLGYGEVYYNGKKYTGKNGMKAAGLQTITLSSKEGLGLNNGTQCLTSIGAITTYDALNTLKLADISAMLSAEALTGIKDAYDPRVHQARGHIGQLATARNFLKLIDGSTSITRQGELRVQDSYSLRCLPQIHGASRDAINYVESKVAIELNAVTDNPLIFPEEEDVISGGNFHGQPMALPFDFLGIALSEIANIAERRIEKMVNHQLSNGLPSFLVKKSGLNSGFMIIQYSAASLVSENKVLAHPASVDSITSCENQEDHVSMGTIAARKAREILFNAQSVLSMEILTACQAIDLRKIDTLGAGTKVAYDLVREKVSFMRTDRLLKPDMNKVDELVFSNKIVEEVEKVVELEN